MNIVVGLATTLRRLLLSLALSLCPAAYAACPAGNQYSFSYGNQTAATLAYGNTYNYTATTSGGATQAFSVALAANGLGTTSTVGGVVTPNIGNLVTDGTVTNNLVFGAIFPARTNAAFTTNFVSATFTFAVPIRDFTVQMNDVDFTANQYRDWVQVIGNPGTSNYNPSLSTPFGTNNTVAGPHTNASSSMVVGAVATSPAVTVTQAAGTGASANNATTGTLTASFAQPVTSVQVKWGNYPLTGTETATGQQAIGIQQISFCPMPSITLTKSSAPWSDPLNGTTNPKLIPGADLIYTLTVANSNSSPVDANALVLTDPLPTTTTFYNGDIDDAGALTTNYEFVPGSSGLSFAAGNLTYSNNGGSTYAYAPAAGYDAAVNAIRLNPQGTMAANSSFSIKFRTRIK